MRSPAGPPRAIIVMGVSGSGKSTLGVWLADALGCPFLEGDDYHPAANVTKMRDGIPLADADRWPWLDRLGRAIGDTVAERSCVVVACSALRRAYCERLEHVAHLPLALILLDVPRDELARRIVQRHDHYIPASLLGSQLATLEPPQAHERALRLDTSLPREEVRAGALAWLREGAHHAE